MSQKRDLHPVTVYLTEDTIAWLEKKGDEFHQGVSATTRRIIMESIAAEMQARLRKRDDG